MVISLPALFEDAWAQALPGQPCPLSGKPDINPTSPHDRVWPRPDIGRIEIVQRCSLPYEDVLSFLSEARESIWQ